jgi:hypothetical protein
MPGLRRKTSVGSASACATMKGTRLSRSAKDRSALIVPMMRRPLAPEVRCSRTARWSGPNRAATDPTALRLRRDLTRSALSRQVNQRRARSAAAQRHVRVRQTPPFEGPESRSAQRSGSLVRTRLVASVAATRSALSRRPSRVRVRREGLTHALGDVRELPIAGERRSGPSGREGGAVRQRPTLARDRCVGRQGRGFCPPIVPRLRKNLIGARSASA